MNVLLADLVLILHLGFVLFVLFGGLLVARWPWFVLAHVPALVWGLFIEISGGVCPLTPLENQLREAAGQQAYSGDFVIRYVELLLYPPDLTAEIQQVLALLVLLVNAGVYGHVLRRLTRGRK